MMSQSDSHVVYICCSRDDRQEKYAATPSYVLGILHVVIGVLIIVLQVIILILFLSVNAIICTINALWFGIYLIITGSFGIKASKKKSSCRIITFMVMSIVSSVVSVSVVLLFQGAMLFEYVYYLSNVQQTTNVNAAQITATFLTSLLVLASMVEFVIAIISSVVCCRGICCVPSSQYVRYRNEEEWTRTDSCMANVIHEDQGAYSMQAGYPGADKVEPVEMMGNKVQPPYSPSPNLPVSLTPSQQSSQQLHLQSNMTVCTNEGHGPLSDDAMLTA